MSYKIKISNSAFDDLAFIKNFIALDNEHKANEYIKKLFEKIDCLQDFPFLGKKGDENKICARDIYFLPCLNHIIIYKVEKQNELIRLVRVVSHYQNWTNILEK